MYTVEMNVRSFYAVSLLGGSLLFGALALWQRERQTWIPVAGEVVQMRERTLERPPLETSHGSFPPEQVTIDLVDYSYVVDGRQYSGTARVGHSGNSSFTVYYDPDRPERSRLDRPEPSANALAVALAVLCFLGGIVLGLGGRRGKAMPQSAPSS